MGLEISSPAKVNLLLKVTGKVTGGYHEITTLFSKITLHDRLSCRLRDDSELRLTCDDPALACSEGNLVLKAARALLESTGCEKGADLHLEKSIPISAGLGGGSSDCATSLRLLSRLWDLEISEENLFCIAKNLGADVPFFLLKNANAIGRGIGEKLAPVKIDRPYHLLLVKPSLAISAKEAYTGSDFSFDPFEIDEQMLADIRSGNPARLAKQMQNDLEPWALSKYPELRKLKSELENCDPAPLKVMMSGSGSTFMALFEDERDLQEALLKITDYPFVMPVKTLV